ncbi:MAG: alpha-1,2-fucosyltransferase [Luteolibacter sp.]
MIRVMLKGRLGNNLFQYAVGRVLAKKHGALLVLGASRLKEKVWKDSAMLQSLPLKAKIVRNLSFGDRLVRKLGWRMTFRKMNLLCEASDSFDPKILEAPDNTLLKGFFQTPLYFDSIADEIRKEIDLDLPDWPKPTLGFSELLVGCESVVVHVRRTDYLGNPEWNVCSMEYYQEAMKKMRTDCSSPRFFIFSDDPEWCRGQFKEPDQTIVDFPEMRENPLHDLFLMTKAKHHIIANSSYSWWGAWLGKKAGQIVLVPPRWTTDFRHKVGEKLGPGWQTVELSDNQYVAV